MKSLKKQALNKKSGKRKNFLQKMYWLYENNMLLLIKLLRNVQRNNEKCKLVR